MEPSLQPSTEPSLQPSAEPSLKPTKAPTIQDTVRLAGNYDELFPSDKEKEDFKVACSEAMHPVQCTEVVRGSIIVTLLGPEKDVEIRKEAQTVNIAGKTFTVLDDEVAKTSDDGGSDIGGMSQAVFFILVALIVIILLLSIVLAKLVFNFDFGMKSDGGGAKGVKRCWPYGGPALSVNSMDVEDGTGVELVENDKDKRHPGSTDLETKSLPELPGENSEEENGVSNFDEAQNDEEVLESQIVEIQGLLANKHILDPHKVFELEEELGGLRTLKAFITQDSERL